VSDRRSWRYRRPLAPAPTRPLWRTLIDLVVFLAALVLVVVALRMMGVTEVAGPRAQVIDGDSLTLKDQEIRLNGIDAPEYTQSCKDGRGADYPCGKQAANMLRALVRGQDVTCQSSETDRYGRALSVCRAGGVELNREMVRLGWAVAYLRHSHDYIGEEGQARAARRGIWQGSFEEPEAYRARNRDLQIAPARP